MPLKIAPSILSAHFERLAEEVKAVEKAGADMIHVDIMDGHFVPNLSMGPIVVQALRRITSLPLDVHLMISHPGKYLDSFADAGAHHITFHIEPTAIRRISCGACGRAAWGRPLLESRDTRERILRLASLFDMVLVMTVHPGFGEAVLPRENLEKVKPSESAKEERPRSSVPLDCAGGRGGSIRRRP